jgi:hypothetical protein
MEEDGWIRDYETAKDLANETLAGIQVMGFSPSLYRYASTQLTHNHLFL